ncbi:MAG: DUF362 domain-containing protein [Anaerolineae bacterium]|nr:DUF362 domain-containing protein [Anaerolineae bacterium]
MTSTVSLIKCTTYDERAVAGAVRQAVDWVGGIEKYVQPGQRVLLKVNLLRASAPDEAICTHPAVIKALVTLVQEAGGHAVIGDSPGGPFTRGWVRGAYDKSGVTQVAEETGAELNWDFGQTHLAHPEGKIVKGLEVGTYVTNADVVIALPKLKTHGFMQFTGATKILFGVIPGTVKIGYHSKFPEPARFGEMLIDILTLIRPALTVMDGIVAMDGQGPSAGDPFRVGALLASADAVALDVVAATLVGLDVRSIYPLQAAIDRGLTTGKIADVSVVGETLDAFAIQGFRAAATGTSSRGIFNLLGDVVRHQIVAAPYATEKCVACGICVRNCPEQAIMIVDKRARMDLSKCIRCYCCHEFCPERAIELRKPWLGRLLGVV